jgi:hypothetical protein
LPTGPRPGGRGAGDTTGSGRSADGRVHLAGVAGVAALAAVAAVLLSDAAPTSWATADACWRGAFAAACALAGSRARRWTLVWISVPGVLLASWSLRVAAGVALLVAVGLLVTGRRNRVVGAAVAGAAAVALLDLRWPDPTGVTAVVAGVAALPVLISGVRRSRPRARRTVGLVGLALVALVGAGLVAAAALGATRRDDALAAIDSTRAAVRAVGDGSPEEARDGFDQAARRFDDLAADTTAWWMTPARAVPVLGSNVAVATAVASSGADLGRTAADLSTSVDQDALRRPGGGIDLGVLASLDGPTSRAADEIAAARTAVDEAGSPWVVGPVADRLDEFTAELESTGRSAELAREASRTAPRLLGAEGPRRYLLLLGNPAEARDIGGHIGNWAEIAVEDGGLRLVELGSPYDLFSPATTPAPTLTPGAHPQSLVELRPQYFPQNWGGTPDMEAVARLAGELYPQARPGAPLDGVLYADPTAFAALLSVTGPVAVPGTDRTIDASNAERFLTVEQFEVIPDNGPGSDALESAIRSTVEGFSTARLPSPARLADVFGPVVDGGGLQFASRHPEDRSLLDRLGLTRRLERDDQDDLLAVVTRNANPSKVDAYLTRRVAYDVSWDPATGGVRSRVTISLTNDAPTDGVAPVAIQPPPGSPPGTNRMQLSVLSPLRATGATLDGSRTGIGTQYETTTVRRHSVLLDVPPGTTRTVVMDLEGVLAPGTYDLRWLGQPLPGAGPTTVTVRPTGGRLEGGRRIREERVPGDGVARVTVRGGG